MADLSIGTPATAPLRIEVLLNGLRVAIAGVEEFGVLSAIVSWVRRSPDSITPQMRAKKNFNERRFLEEICELDLGGLNSVTDEHLSWAKQALGPGTEVTIRILPAGEFDPPRPNPKK